MTAAGGRAVGLLGTFLLLAKPRIGAAATLDTEKLIPSTNVTQLTVRHCGRTPHSNSTHSHLSHAVTPRCCHLTLSTRQLLADTPDLSSKVSHSCDSSLSTSSFYFLYTWRLKHDTANRTRQAPHSHRSQPDCCHIRQPSLARLCLTHPSTSLSSTSTPPLHHLTSRPPPPSTTAATPSTAPASSFCSPSPCSLSTSLSSG